MVEKNIHQDGVHDQTMQGVVIQQGDSSIGTNVFIYHSVTSSSLLIDHEWASFHGQCCKPCWSNSYFINKNST